MYFLNLNRSRRTKECLNRSSHCHTALFCRRGFWFICSPGTNHCRWINKPCVHNKHHSERTHLHCPSQPSAGQSGLLHSDQRCHPDLHCHLFRCCHPQSIGGSWWRTVPEREICDSIYSSRRSDNYWDWVWSQFFSFGRGPPLFPLLCLHPPPPHTIFDTTILPFVLARTESRLVHSEAFPCILTSNNL